MASEISRLSDSEIMLRAAYYEAGGEGIEGMALVIRSILNRYSLLQSQNPSLFNARGGSIEEIISASGQYETYSNGSLSRAIPKKDRVIVKEALQLARNTEELGDVLLASGVSEQDIGPLLNATGFRTPEARPDASQEKEVTSFRGHLFNTAGVPDKGVQVAEAEVPTEEVPTESDRTRGPLPSEITPRGTYRDLPPAESGADQTDSFPSVSEEDDDTITAGGGQDTLEGRGDPDSLNAQTDDLLQGSIPVETDDSRYQYSPGKIYRQLLETPSKQTDGGPEYTPEEIESRRGRTELDPEPNSTELLEQATEQERLDRIANLESEDDSDGNTPISEMLRNFFSISDDLTPPVPHDEQAGRKAIRDVLGDDTQVDYSTINETMEEQNLNRGGSVERQVKFGKSSDSVEKKELPDPPPGATPEEVADDIPAYLSTGEYVLPANVVRYIGLKTITGMHQKVLHELQQMEDLGIIRNVDHNGEVEDDDDEMLYKGKASEEMEDDIKGTIIIASHPQGLMKPEHYADGGDVWLPGTGYVGKKKGIVSDVQNIDRGYEVPQDHLEFKDVPRSQDGSWETEEESRYVDVSDFSEPGYPEWVYEPGGWLRAMWEGTTWTDPKTGKAERKGGFRDLSDLGKKVYPSIANFSFQLAEQLKGNARGKNGELLHPELEGKLVAGTEYPIGGWWIKPYDEDGQGWSFTRKQYRELTGKELPETPGGTDHLRGDPSYTSVYFDPDKDQSYFDNEPTSISTDYYTPKEPTSISTDYYNPPDVNDTDPFGGGHEFSKGGSINRLAPGGLMYNPASGFRAAPVTARPASDSTGYKKSEAGRYIPRNRHGLYEDDHLRATFIKHNLSTSDMMEGGGGGPNWMESGISDLVSGELARKNSKAADDIHDQLERRHARKSGGLPADKLKQVLSKRLDIDPKDITNRHALQYYLGRDMESDQRYLGGDPINTGWGDTYNKSRELAHRYFESPDADRLMKDASKRWNDLTGMTYGSSDTTAADGKSSIDLNAPYDPYTTRTASFFLRHGRWPKPYAWGQALTKWDEKNAPKETKKSLMYNPGVGFRS